MPATQLNIAEQRPLSEWSGYADLIAAITAAGNDDLARNALIETVPEQYKFSSLEINQTAAAINANASLLDDHIADESLHGAGGGATALTSDYSTDSEYIGAASALTHDINDRINAALQDIAAAQTAANNASTAASNAQTAANQAAANASAALTEANSKENEGVAQSKVNLLESELRGGSSPTESLKSLRDAITDGSGVTLSSNPDENDADKAANTVASTVLAGRITTAQSAADNAQSTADSATSAANTALSSASNAQSTATAANNTANAAESKADDAQADADQAAADAAAVEGIANTANSNASQAVSTANTAQTTANAANTRVNLIGDTYTIPANTVFDIDEQPTTQEIKDWQVDNYPNLDEHSFFLYESDNNVTWLYSMDGDGIMTHLSRHDPGQSGGVYVVPVSSPDTLTSDTNANTLRRYRLEGETPLVTPTGYTEQAVEMTLGLPLKSTDKFQVERNSPANQWIRGRIDGDNDGIVLNVNKGAYLLSAEVDLSGWKWADA